MNAADISTDNSSVALLGIGGVFTGTWEDCHHYGSVSVSAWSNRASAANGFVLQFSNDAVNVIKSITRTLAAGTGEWIRDEIPAKWVRVVYTNGGIAQTTFSLEMLKKYIDVARVAVESEDDPVNVVVTTLVPATGVAYTDRSLAVAVGGTAEPLMAANAARKVLGVANPMENMEIVWVSAVTTAAVQGLGSIPIFPGGMWEPEVPPLGAISVLAPTTGTNVSAWEG